MARHLSNKAKDLVLALRRLRYADVKTLVAESGVSVRQIRNLFPVLQAKGLVDRFVVGATISGQYVWRYFTPAR
jgi:hypothetical protein